MRIRYAQALRATGQRAQAAAVLENAAMHNPDNKALLGAYGRALADAGNFKQALDVLERAHSPDQPDWRILSVQGAVLDQMGRHEEAQRYYASALKIVPDEPSVLSNLGLSYALSKDLKRAEDDAAARLRATATGDKRVRQNLALVVGLQGRFQEAETIARADLPPDEAAANVAYLRADAGPEGRRNLKKTIRCAPSRDWTRSKRAGRNPLASPAPSFCSLHLQRDDEGHTALQKVGVSFISLAGDAMSKTKARATPAAYVPPSSTGSSPSTGRAPDGLLQGRAGALLRQHLAQIGDVRRRLVRRQVGRAIVSASWKRPCSPTTSARFCRTRLSPLPLAEARRKVSSARFRSFESA